MTFFAIRLAPLRATRAARVCKLAAAFHTTPLRAALNESDRDNPNVAEHTESHKEESLHKVKQGDGEWKAELASNSEQTVKHDDHDMSFEEMQKEGAAKAEEGKQPNKSKKAAGT